MPAGTSLAVQASRFGRRAGPDSVDGPPIHMIWVTHMKTTIDIADPLFAQGKALAAREGVSFRALIEEGLRVVLARRNERRTFRLRDASVSGEGLQPGLSWDLPRDLAYEDETP